MTEFALLERGSTEDSWRLNDAIKAVFLCLAWA